MNDEYLSQTELGKLYGVSSHVVGRWLKGLGLRDAGGNPTDRAKAEGFAKREPSTKPGTYFYAWHREKTCEQFDGMEYPRAAG
jgi:hypothetical protein